MNGHVNAGSRKSPGVAYQKAPKRNSTSNCVPAQVFEETRLWSRPGDAAEDHGAFLLCMLSATPRPDNMVTEMVLLPAMGFPFNKYFWGYTFLMIIPHKRRARLGFVDDLDSHFQK